MKKEKKKGPIKISFERLLLICFAVIVAFESIALILLISATNGKKSLISGKEWVNSYTYNGVQYRNVMKFDKSNKFEYDIYKDDEKDLNSSLEGKYYVVNDKIIIEYTQSSEIVASVVYLVKDYMCFSSNTCDDNGKFYESTDKRSKEYKDITDGYTNDEEDEDEDTSYLKNKPEHKKVSEPTVYIFHGDGCPHCADLLNWLNSYKSKKSFKTVKYEVWNNKDNSKLMQKVGKYLNADAGGVPFIVIGDQTIVGFDESSTPDEFASLIDEAYNNIAKNKYYDVIETVKK